MVKPNSPYILFSISKMQEYHSKFNHVKVTSLSSRISREWKDMSEEDKDHWRRAAERDKMRYNAEKSTFTGPWTVARNKRPPKDPSAPKRPPSAFLNFCRSRRRVLCQANPGLKNTDISKLLGHEWRSASEDMKRPFVEQEQQERQAYHIRIAAWKEERKHQEDFVKHHQQELVLEDPLLSYTESEGFEAMAPAQPEAIDWSMTASTSMSLKPVPITATAMNTFASKPLPIAPRKVTLDVDSSQEVDNITASSTSHLALSTDETFFNTLSGQHAVISSTPPADDSLAVPMERPIASSPSATFATRATNMNTLAEAASKFEDNSIPMLHYGKNSIHNVKCQEVTTCCLISLF